MDFSFNIPHALLEKKFSSYEIKTDIIQQAVIAGINFLNIEHAPQSKRARYLIGWIARTMYTTIETDFADIGGCWVALVEGYNANNGAQGSGKSLVPSSNFEALTNFVDPYENPIYIPLPEGSVADSTGAVHIQSMDNACVKFNLEYMSGAGKPIHILYQNDAAAINIFSYLIWAEGVLR